MRPDTCRLGIGPSQQYEGGEELYLDQAFCDKGTIICYYTGRQITAEEASASSSRYIFQLRLGKDEVQYIDAEDTDSGYGRYADDSLYNGTENATWEVRGVGKDRRLALVATDSITRGMPIRAPYGWEYWYQPERFTIELMQKAFTGYLGEISHSKHTKLAWDFATLVAGQEALLQQWGGIRRHEVMDELEQQSTKSDDDDSVMVAFDYQGAQQRRIKKRAMTEQLDRQGKKRRASTQTITSRILARRETRGRRGRSLTLAQKSRVGRKVTEATPHGTAATERDWVVHWPALTRTLTRITDILSLSENSRIETDGRRSLYRDDFVRIINGKLNDDIVHEYMLLLSTLPSTARVEFIPPTLSPYILGIAPMDEQRAQEIHNHLRNHELYTSDYLLCPLITGDHITVVVADRERRSITHYDSLNHGQRQKALRLAEFLQQHRDWRLRLGVQDMTEPPQLMEGWRYEGHSKHATPQQEDGEACGVFMLAIVTLLISQQPIQSFEQAQVSDMRRHIANCILMHTCPPLEVTTGQGVSVGRPYQYNTQQDSRQRVQRLPRSVMRRPDTRSQEIVDLTVAATDDADSTPRPNRDQGNDQLVNAFIIDLAMQTTSNNVQDSIEGTTTDMLVETGEQHEDLTRYMARRQLGQSPLRPTGMFSITGL